MPARVGRHRMKTGRLPPRLLACLGLAGLLVGLLAMPSALADAGPTISSFAPICGPVGTNVDVNGNNFQGATHVTFNGVEASVSVQSGHLIKTTVPTSATTGKIGVVTDDGSATSADDFTGAMAVKFGGVSAGTFSVNGAGTRITAIVPSGAVTGKITVTTPGGTATSATNFTVTGVAAPTISSFSPTSGPVGTSVRINGTGFGGAIAVKFNGVSASSITVNSQGTLIDT